MSKYTAEQVSDLADRLELNAQDRYGALHGVRCESAAAILRDYAAHLREREAAKAVTDELCYRNPAPDASQAPNPSKSTVLISPMLASARVPDAWEPTDAEVMAWMERSDIDNRSVSDMRTAIDDARSMHMLAAAPKRGEG